MKPTFCLFAALSCALVAADPPRTPSGKVVVLDNGQVIEGDVTRWDDRYRIIRDGGETTLPATRVVAVCADLTAAYEVLRGRIDARDVPGRLKLARWCQSAGLHAQAFQEANAALALRPSSTDAQRLVKQLQQAPPASRAQSAAPAPAPAIEKPPAVEVGAETLRIFATKVQPVLMNACASCHASPTATVFRLNRVYADGLNTRPATHHNLSAAAAVIDASAPLNSKFLKLAVTAHGGATVPPLRDKSMPAYRLLEDWAVLLASERSPAARPATPAPAGTVVQTSATEAKPGKPNDSKPAADDPFDPAIFNRQHHPTPNDAPTPPPKP